MAAWGLRVVLLLLLLAAVCSLAVAEDGARQYCIIGAGPGGLQCVLHSALYTVALVPRPATFCWGAGGTTFI